MQKMVILKCHTIFDHDPLYIDIMPCQLMWFVLVSQINTREEGLHIDSISVGKILSKNNQTIKLAHNQQW